MNDSKFSQGRRRIVRSLALGIGALMLIGFAGTPAKADLKLCNNTASRVGVAIGYKDREGWASEGWWTAEPQKCLTLLKGTLIARYYYVYAVDYDKGGSWGGKAMMCILTEFSPFAASTAARAWLPENRLLRGRHNQEMTGQFPCLAKDQPGNSNLKCAENIVRVRNSGNPWACSASGLEMIESWFVAGVESFASHEPTSMPCL